jgi:glycosyltransferase involved in cell wall biosynthesis
MADLLPRFTVIIPSRNRARFLAHTLRTCMMQDYDNMEVIVADDGSTENNREIVEHAAQRDPRIRYLPNAWGPGMRDNFEFALTQVQPGYVIALGGDDGLLPGGLSGMQRLLHETKSELLTWPAPVFTYPGIHGQNGQLMFYRARGCRLVDSQAYIDRQVRTLRYLGDIEAPMFYVKGVVSTRLIDAVRGRSADRRFYRCSTPDGYSGIVLAGETPRFAFSGRPFSLHGVSRDSQGAAYLRDDPDSKILSQRFFDSVANIPMHRELASQPYSPLITLMTADFLLTARDLPGWSGRVADLDFRKLITIALQELGHGMYSDERIGRELRILSAIADLHDIASFFRRELRTARRQPSRQHFSGGGLNTRALFFDGGRYGLNDIVDAAYAAKTLYQVYDDAISGGFVSSLTRSLLYRMHTVGRRRPFPTNFDAQSPAAEPL